MCSKLIIGALLGSLIQGSAGKCMTSQEVASASAAEMAKVSPSCLTSLSTINGATPPGCNGGTACNVDVVYDMIYKCTGENCRYMPVLENGNTTQQAPLCMTAACQNSADGSIYLKAWEMALSSAVACAMANKTSGNSAQTGMSIETQVSMNMASLVCNGQVVSKIVNDNSASSAPKLDTCLDVKKEYQRQKCCDMPTKMFDMGDTGMKNGTRRLSQDTLVEDVKLFLEEAKMQGGASHASNMAADLISFVENWGKEEEAHRRLSAPFDVFDFDFSRASALADGYLEGLVEKIAQDAA